MPRKRKTSRSQSSSKRKYAPPLSQDCPNIEEDVVCGPDIASEDVLQALNLQKHQLESWSLFTHGVKAAPKEFPLHVFLADSLDSSDIEDERDKWYYLRELKFVGNLLVIKELLPHSTYIGLRWLSRDKEQCSIIVCLDLVINDGHYDIALCTELIPSSYFHAYDLSRLCCQEYVKLILNSPHTDIELSISVMLGKKLLHVGSPDSLPVKGDTLVKYKSFLTNNFLNGSETTSLESLFLKVNESLGETIG